MIADNNLLIVLLIAIKQTRLLLSARLDSFKTPLGVLRNSNLRSESVVGGHDVHWLLDSRLRLSRQGEQLAIS